LLRISWAHHFKWNLVRERITKSQRLMNNLTAITILIQLINILRNICNNHVSYQNLNSLWDSRSRWSYSKQNKPRGHLFNNNNNSNLALKIAILRTQTISLKNNPKMHTTRVMIRIWIDSLMKMIKKVEEIQAVNINLPKMKMI